MKEKLEEKVLNYWAKTTGGDWNWVVSIKRGKSYVELNHPNWYFQAESLKEAATVCIDELMKEA